MNDNAAAALERELSARGAILSGHFRLSSGRHSNRFVQKFRILEDPQLVEHVARSLAAAVESLRPTVVVSAAIGGIVLGYEMARQLDTLAIFVEKEGGTPVLRRGFTIERDARVLVVEDVVTTGRSVREVIDVVHAVGADVAGVAIIVQRAPVDFGVPAVALLDLPIASFDPAECPQCAAGDPLSEPGSRFLHAGGAA